MAISGKGVAFTAAGFIVTWSGIKNTTLKVTLQDLLKGQNPATVTEAAPTLGIGSDTAAAGSSAPAGTVPASTLPAVKGGYSSAELQTLWTSSGGNPAKASVAACIAMHESSGDATVTSPNPDGGTNVGLWQLDTKGKGAGYSVAQLQDPQTNAHVAIMGSSNGEDWSAWATAGDCGA